jgi:hypothetical protein
MGVPLGFPLGFQAGAEEAEGGGALGLHPSGKEWVSRIGAKGLAGRRGSRGWDEANLALGGKPKTEEPRMSLPKPRVLDALPKDFRLNPCGDPNPFPFSQSCPFDPPLEPKEANSQ